MEGRAGSDVFGDEIGVLTHAIAGALDLDDNGVMEQAVEQRGGDDRIAEHLSPLGEAAVRVRIIAPFSYRALTSWKNRLPPPWVTGR